MQACFTCFFYMFHLMILVNSSLEVSLHTTGDVILHDQTVGFSPNLDELDELTWRAEQWKVRLTMRVLFELIQRLNASNVMVIVSC